MKKIFWAGLGLAVVGLFVWTGIFLYQKSQEKPVVYETVTPFTTDIYRKTVATGKITPRKEIEIKPQVSGVVSKLYVEAGDSVNKGDLLARIELIPDMEQLNNAESRLETAHLNLRTAKLEYERQKALYEDKLIGEIEYNKYLLNFRLQQESVRAAESAVDLIKEGASKRSGKVANLVRSTVNGMVLRVPVREGSFVTETNTFNQGTTIAHVADMRDLIFEGQLDESEISKVKKDMELTLNVGAIDEETFHATLEYISPKAIEDDGAVKFEIRAAIDIRDDVLLRAGYSATADIVLDKRLGALAINEGNLVIENGKPYVDVETTPQEFTRTELVTGLSDGINIEVLSGISSSTQIKKMIP